MKLELKAIKHTVWASEETHCYQASLYVDGKPVAIVSNDGHGGCDRDYSHPKFKGDYRAQMKAVDEYFKTLPNEPSDWSEDGFPQKLDSRLRAKICFKVGEPSCFMEMATLLMPFSCVVC